MEKLIYEKPTLKRKKEAVAFIQEFFQYNSPINGVGGLDKFLKNYEDWLKKLDNDLITPISDDRVPAATFFLVRENDNKIVGMSNIRLALNNRLKKSSGHIGYCIRPTERQKGYNKINLYLALKELKKNQAKQALITCYKNNIASAKTIVALGGILLKEEQLDGKILQFYSIDIKKSLEDNKKYCC